MTAILLSVEPDGQRCRVAIAYVDDSSKETITDHLSAPDMAAVQAIARQRSLSFKQNAAAVELLRAFIGQEIDLTEPVIAPPKPDPERDAYFAARSRYSLLKRLADEGLPVQGLDAAKADRDAKFKPEYEGLA